MRELLAFLSVVPLLCWIIQAVASVAADPEQHSVSLTMNNFDETTRNKTVFIKCFAPWCSHCQELAPAWDAMAVECSASVKGPLLLVGQVDCTQDQDLCEHFDIQGLPTLLYGDPSELGAYLHEYRGPKTAEALVQFAKSTLAEPMCSPANLEPCDPQRRVLIETVLAMSTQELEEAIAKKEQEIEDAETTFEIEFQTMQAQYDALASDHQANEARLKANIKLIKAVQQAAAAAQ